MLNLNMLRASRKYLMLVPYMKKDIPSNSKSLSSVFKEQRISFFIIMTLFSFSRFYLKFYIKNAQRYDFESFLFRNCLRCRLFCVKSFSFPFLSFHLRNEVHGKILMMTKKAQNAMSSE